MAEHTPPTNTSISLRVLARLLSYPDGALRDDLPDMRAALLVERALSSTRKDELYALLQRLEESPPLDVESEFVELFDRGHATSLHLFEHVHGDSRDRGPAMADLTLCYEKAGLFLAAGELPDYLPVVLEFASTQPAQQACALLGEMAHILNAIFSALQLRKSPYACVLGALIELTGEPAQSVRVTPDAAIDAAWEEPAVFAGCSMQGQSAASPTRPIHFVKTSSAGAPAAAPTGASQ